MYIKKKKKKKKKNWVTLYLQLGSLCISKHRVLRLVVEESGFNRDALLRRVETAPEAEKVEESMRGIF
jgi:hypothetical protein